MPNVHRFTDSGMAYDASQCRDDIHDGDVLVVNGGPSPHEQSAAILMGAWPICVNPGAVVDRTTCFDCPKPGSTVAQVIFDYCAQSWVETKVQFYDASVALAYSLPEGKVVHRGG